MRLLSWTIDDRRQIIDDKITHYVLRNTLTHHALCVTFHAFCMDYVWLTVWPIIPRNVV